MYAFILIASMAAIYYSSQELTKKLGDAEAIDNAREIMNLLDRAIEDVSNGPEGKMREITVSSGRGEFRVSSLDEMITFTVETELELLKPQSYQKTGRIAIDAYAATSLTNGSINGVPCWILENEHIRTCIIRTEGPIAGNAGDLVHHISNKEIPEQVNMTLLFGVNERLQGVGSIETRPLRIGEFLGEGTVLSEVETAEGVKFGLSFTLKSGSDFLLIEFIEGDSF